MEVAIVGAGAVGVATAGSLLNKGLCSRLELSDLSDEKAEGEALDFIHGSPLFPPVKVGCSQLSKARGLDLCIIAAGAKSRPNETRLQLVERNLAAIDTIASGLEKNGLPRFALVLTNPVDIITEALRRRWQKKGVVVFGSGTALDTFRLRKILAEKVCVSPANVHAWVVGEHGDSSVSLMSSARVGSAGILEFARFQNIPETEIQFDDIQNQVRKAAYRVIQLKGATAHAIGLTTASLVEALVKDDQAFFPVSIEIEPGVCGSLPCIIGKNGPGRPLVPQMNPVEKALYEESLSILRRFCMSIPN